MDWILPKGIVRNSSTVNQGLESIDQQPVDPADIAQFWKVYTTTKRRLLDPTAERLENYWWRIWGSRRRELNGATVALLFVQISDGQSFVPLRGPANRDEGTPPLRNACGPGLSSTVSFQNQNSNSRPSTTSSSTASKTPVIMPHPILKKSRGPLTTGPRPTARFISPHDSENEDLSLGSTNSHVFIQPPSPDTQNHKAEKKIIASGNGRRPGFVASSASKKKRPAIMRRKSSQSSGESAKATGGQDAVPRPSSEKTPPTLLEPESSHDKARVQTKFQENLSPTPEKSPKKRTPPRVGEGKKTTLKTVAEFGRGSEISTDGDPGPSTLQRVENMQSFLEDLDTEEQEELEMQRILLAEANARMQEKPSTTRESIQQNSRSSSQQKQILRSQNRSSSEGNLALGANRYLHHGNKSDTILAPTLTDATGEMELGDSSSDAALRTSPARNKGKGRDPNQHGEPISFTKRPVQPSPATSAGTPSLLARSMSQLTLVLEKDRVRSTEHKPSNESKKGKKG